MRFAVIVMLAASALTVGCSGTSSVNGADGSVQGPDGDAPDAGLPPSVDAAGADRTSPAVDAGADVDADATSPVGDADAASDATPPAEDAPSSGEAGPSCTPGGSCTQPNVCKNGQYVCGDAGLTCEATTDVPDGTVCGTDKVCSAGACVSCATGSDCTPPNSCVKKTVNCTTGAPVCEAAGNEPNGTSCGAQLYCNNGVCAACTTNAPCVPPGQACHLGTTSCASGAATCTDTGAAAPNGTSCGTNEVCSGGACVACTAGLSCTPANACHTGTTSCASGASVCTDTGTAVPDGTSCGTGEVCGNGTCAACVPKTCQTAGATCGTPPDGCGHLLATCGTCSAPTTCGGDGVPFQCACPSGTWTTQAMTVPASRAIVAHGGQIDIAGGTVGGGSVTTTLSTAPLPGLGVWTSNTVEVGAGSIGTSQALGISPALALDPSGDDHVISMMESLDPDTIAWGWQLNDASGSGASWTISRIDSESTAMYGACVGTPSPAVAIDSAGTVHVLYNDCTDALHQSYASRVSGQTTWQKTSLATTAADVSAIAVDSSGGLYAVVGIPGAGNAAIHYAYRAPGLPWPATFTSIDPAGTVANASLSGAAVAVDASGTVYVAYETAHDDVNTTPPVTQTVRVGVLPKGGAWSFVTLDHGYGNPVLEQSVALALSGKGVPHVVYVTGDGSKLVHAVRAGTGWTNETIDTASGGSWFAGVGIAVDSSGGVEVTYGAKSSVVPSMYAYRCP